MDKAGSDGVILYYFAESIRGHRTFGNAVHPNIRDRIIWVRRNRKSLVCTMVYRNAAGRRYASVGFSRSRDRMSVYRNSDIAAG